MIHSTIEGALATVVYASMDGEMLLPISPKSLGIGGLFLNKKTGLYSFYLKGTNSTIETCDILHMFALEEEEEYVELIGKVLELIKEARYVWSGGTSCTA